MKLLTQDIIKKLPPLFSQDGKEPEDIPIIARFFTPDAQCTWWITEGTREGNDWCLFGLCDLGLGFPELGMVMLSELENLRGNMGLPVERDRYWQGSLRDAMRQAGMT